MTITNGKIWVVLRKKHYNFFYIAFYMLYIILYVITNREKWRLYYALFSVFVSSKRLSFSRRVAQLGVIRELNLSQLTYITRKKFLQNSCNFFWKHVIDTGSRSVSKTKGNMRFVRTITRIQMTKNKNPDLFYMNSTFHIKQISSRLFPMK